MIALAARFESGRISATDCVRIVGAGLRGAGHDISDEAVASMKSECGASGFIEIVARLLSATFGASANSSEPSSAATCDEAPGREERQAAPFPGKTS